MATNIAWLQDHFTLAVIQRGGQSGWPTGERIYLQCPQCRAYVSTATYDECLCGGVSIDADYSRVIVSQALKGEVIVYRATPKG